MADKVSFNERASILAPARFQEAVSFTGTNDYIPSHETRALHIGTAGTIGMVLACDLASGNTTAVTLVVSAGETLAVQVGNIKQASSAGGMVVFW